jgi:hypothetical protein
MKILVLPDIHGRDFWREPCQHIDDYDKVIFLGDYLDPYSFEGITVEQAIDNFKDILLFAKDNPKVVMLLGNHDMPYFSQTYYGLESWHCRHSREFHKVISEIFKEHEDLFKIAHVEDGLLFTHAGCHSGWLSYMFNEKYDKKIDLDELCSDLNSLLKDKHGLRDLFMVSRNRGGYDPFGSCIWSDVNELYWDTANSLSEEKEQFPIYKINQVFGHTLQAFENQEGEIYYGKPVEFRNCKMVDNTKAYELDTETFTIKEFQNHAELSET